MGGRLLLLIVVLTASPALAGESYPAIRNLTFSRHPRNEAPTIHVGGLVATVLRFEKPCDTERTKLTGWEGRFEKPVVEGRTVVLFPLRDLSPEDRFPLLVTLVDGTQLPFTVTSYRQTVTERMVDQQVNVFFNPGEMEAILGALYNSLEREDELREQLRRYRQKDSINSALASLLAKGERHLTPFRKLRKPIAETRLATDSGAVDIAATTLYSKDKAAVVFSVVNPSRAMPWQLREAHLTNSRGEEKSFGLGMDHEVIPPKSSGRLAVVADRSAFVSAGRLENLALTLHGSGGTRDAYILVNPPPRR